MTTLELLTVPGMSGSKQMMDLYSTSQKKMNADIKNQRIAAALMSRKSAMLNSRKK